MDQKDIQFFCDKNNFDLRKIQEWHFRVLDEYNSFVLDVYIKRNKNGNIQKNTVKSWKNNKWYICHSVKDLEKLKSYY